MSEEKSPDRIRNLKKKKKDNSIILREVLSVLSSFLGRRFSEGVEDSSVEGGEIIRTRSFGNHPPRGSRGSRRSSRIVTLSYPSPGGGGGPLLLPFPYFPFGGLTGGPSPGVEEGA